MSVLKLLEENLSNFSRNERRVADFILAHPKSIKELSCEAVSATCNASRSTVLRLCQKLGYQGYSDFKFALLSDLENTESALPTTSPQDHLAQEIPHAISYYFHEIMQMESLLDSQILDTAIDAISHANRVITLGMLHSAVSAQQFAFRLNKFGVDAHAISDYTIMASYERILKSGDVVVIFSISGRDTYISLAEEYRKNRVKVILITMTSNCSLSNYVDTLIAIPYPASISGMYPVDEAPIFFMVIEMLIESLHQKLQQLV